MKNSLEYDLKLLVGRGLDARVEVGVVTHHDGRGSRHASGWKGEGRLTSW